MTTSSPKEKRAKAARDIEELYKLAKPVEGKDNHNYLALRGADVDDMEFVEEFGVPKEYVKTRMLNEWMLDHMMEENINYLDADVE